MIQHEKEYRAFIQKRGVGLNDDVASSVDSYVSYLRSVSKILSKDITPDILRSERDISSIVVAIGEQRKEKTINNYRSAMRQYVAFVSENGY